MKPKYYILVRILKGDENKKVEDMEIVEGVRYYVDTLKQAKEDAIYIDTYMNL